jgi:hypothetical protein
VAIRGKASRSRRKKGKGRDGTNASSLREPEWLK